MSLISLPSIRTILPGTLAEFNDNITDATLDDSGASRPPTNHAANHTDGTDDIQNATAAQKGLATAVQITKLDGIATGAVADHGALTGLSDDDHSQYLLVDGTRAMSGDLDMGGNGITKITQLKDANGNELVKFTTTASAVNEITIANAATGGRPTFTASGDDTNIGLTFNTKGTGSLLLDADHTGTGGSITIMASNSVSISAQAIQFAAIGSPGTFIVTAGGLDVTGAPTIFHSAVTMDSNLDVFGDLTVFGDFINPQRNSNVAADGSTLSLARGEGTKDTPITLSSGAFVSQILAKGYDGADYDLVAEIRTIATENHTATNHGTKMEFYVTADAAATPSLALTIEQSKQISFDAMNVRVTPNAIISTDTNGDLSLTPDGTGNLILDGLKWPQADGTASYVLKTDGSSQLSWVSQSAGDVTAAANMTDHSLIRGNGGAKGVQDTGILIDDSDNMLFPTVAEMQFRGAGTSIYSSAGSTLRMNAPGTLDFQLSDVSAVKIDSVGIDMLGNEIEDLSKITDANDNELIIFTTAASAVNEITIQNAATGNGPRIISTGDDAAVDLLINPKGAGDLILGGFKWPQTDGSSGEFLTTDGAGQLSFAGALLADGSVALTANWDAGSFNIRCADLNVDTAALGIAGTVGFGSQTVVATGGSAQPVLGVDAMGGKGQPATGSQDGWLKIKVGTVDKWIAYWD